MQWYTLQSSIQDEYANLPFLASKPKRRIVIASILLYACLLNAWQNLFDPRQASTKGAITIILPGGSLALLAAALILLVLVVARLKSVQRRKALERIIEMYRLSGLALVRYVMLNRQCLEEEAYRRIATFVKSHVPLDEYSTIDSMLAYDRQSLLDRALSILVSDPDAIDKI